MNLDELRGQIDALNTEFQELRDGERTLDSARRLVEIQAELKVKEADVAVFEQAAAALEAKDAEAAIAVAGDGDEVKGDDAEGDDAGGKEGDEVAAPAVVEPAEVVESVEDKGDVVSEDAKLEPVLLAASADVDVSPSAHGVVTQERPRLTASASGGGVNHGDPIDRDGMKELLSRSLTAAGHAQGRKGGARGSLMTMSKFADGTEALSETNSSWENARIIRDAIASKSKGSSYSLTAAACFCGPDEVVDDLFELGTTDRPVSNLFPSIPVRGTWRYPVNTILENVPATAVGIWTCTDQDGVDLDDPLTWKDCSELDCFTERQVIPYMIKGCTNVSVMHRFAHPNQIDAWINLLRVDYARKAERALLDTIEVDAGTPLTVGAGTMAGHGLKSLLVYALSATSFALGYQYRTDALDDFTLIIPQGFIDRLLADEWLRGFDHNKTRAEMISKLENDLGLRIATRLDTSTAGVAAANAAVVALNNGGTVDNAGTDTVPPDRLYLVDTSQYVHGMGELVNAEWMTDTSKTRQNMVQYFWENMEFLEQVGPRKPHVIDIAGCVSGARSDLIAPPAC